MRAWEIRGEGGVDALALGERPAPEPGPGEVLVRVHASSINYRDLATIENPTPRGIVYPRVPNSDAAGEVVAVGPGVERVRVGERVMSTFFRRWPDGAIDAEAMASALGGAIDGVLAESVVLGERAVVPIPEHLSFVEAATLPCAGVTAWHSLVEFARVQPGDTVLLLGTGGVSVFALQIVGMLGARAIVTSSSDEKLERAKGLGAWRTVNYRREPEWERAVVAATDGRGVDHVVEVGGPGTLARSVAAVRVGGSIGLIGVLSGGQLDPTPIMRKSIRLQGIYVGSTAMHARLARAVAAHRLSPVVDRVFRFEDARDAYRAMRAAGHLGKLVITLDG
ncbi:MAG: NAD(P)-dependent alcohol dehydrogenase [Ectothiorhodospiraceae bacterium]|nr:NAD(P)-dependent alcohol dehydrogenase [Ectothiorhodospiraceae bacterium]